MKLHHLRDILAVVERGGINAAARHLGVSQPSLSRSVRELEKELGTPLLERHSGGTVPTAMGLLFARRASSAINELRRARDEIHQASGGEHGAVTACVSSVSHIALLSEALAPFRTRYPNVQLKVIEGVYPVIESRLRNGVADFYIGSPPVEGLGTDLQLEKLFDNQRVVLGRHGHPLAAATSMKELVGADWVSGSITQAADNEYAALFQKMDLPPPKIALQAESALTWLTAVACTDMLVITPLQWVDSPIARAVLQPIPVKEPLEAPPIVLICRASVPLTPAAEHLSDLMRRPAARIQNTGRSVKLSVEPVARSRRSR